MRLDMGIWHSFISLYNWEENIYIVLSFYSKTSLEFEFHQTVFVPVKVLNGNMRFGKINIFR